MGTVLEYTEEQFHSIFSLCSNVLNSKGAHVSADSWTWSIHTGNWCGRLFFAIHELRERSPKPWFTLSTHFLVEQQSGQLSLCHVDVRSALEPWLSCPDQGFVQRSPDPFCCPAFQDHSKTCFHWMHLCPLFLLASLFPCQPGMTFFLHCFPVFAPGFSAVCRAVCGRWTLCILPGVLWGIDTLCRGHKPWGIYEETTNCYNIFRDPQIKGLLKQGYGVDAATGILCCFKNTEEIKTPTAPFQCLAQAEVALGPLFSFWLSDCFCTWMSFFFSLMAIKHRRRVLLQL